MTGPPTSDYFLTTTRLGLRHWRAEDLDLARGLWGDPQVARWIDARGQLTDAQVRERLADEIRCQRTHGVQYWPVFRIDDARHVGCCGLRPHAPASRIYELGFHICAHSWRKGFAAEAARAVIAHAFGPLAAAGLFAGHHPRNRASQQLLRKLGFEYTHDEYYAATGCRHPSYRLPAPDRGARTIRLEKQPGELYKILKFANLVSSGGEAKYRIASGDVRVNGRIETRKRKKIAAGDQIEFQGSVYRITVADREAS
jgi:RimJ/RimL family protein N-acetyltransferase/ribosome-associated protein YbcJ (S4-like RNA binding protein)